MSRSICLLLVLSCLSALFNADGTGVTAITGGAEVDFGPVWSPDGKSLAWIRAGDGTGRIWVSNADGSNAHPISSDLRYLENLAWSPWPNRIAFDCDFDGDYFTEAAAIKADGSSPSSLEWVYDPGGDLIDAQMGSYAPSGGWLVLSRVEYVVIDEELYVKSAKLDRISDTGDWSPGQQFPGSGLDMMADWERTDFVAPVSKLGPVPARASYEGIRLTWSGSDTGGSGFHYDLQYRQNGGPWERLLEYTNDTSYLIGSQAVGSTLYFRVRATDEAGNVEPWASSPDGEGRTTFYWEGYSGRVLDARGVAVPGAAITGPADAAGPLRSAADGAYEAYSDADIASLTAAHRGYRALPAATNWNAGRSHRLDFALPPRTELIQNGGFESGLAGWQASGGENVTAVEGAGHTGMGYLLLGSWNGAGEGVSSVSHVVRLPDAAARPTLSFFMAPMPGFPQLPLDVVTATVRIAGGAAKPLALHRSDPAGEWTHAWADLTPWGGKEVTVTVQVTQSLPQQTGRIQLDEISVGEWLTPSIYGATPARELPATITIRGENFEPGAVARVDGNDLVTTFVDAATLTALVPEGTRVGLRGLWVTNPGGEQAQGAVLVGRPVLLPFVTRGE